MMTRRQLELLDFIGAYMATENVSPSYDEMKDGMGLKSKCGINRLVAGLEERGFIRRLPHRARSIEILRTVEPPLQPRAKLDAAQTADLIAELEARGYHIERQAA